MDQFQYPLRNARWLHHANLFINIDIHLFHYMPKYLLVLNMPLWIKNTFQMFL